MWELRGLCLPEAQDTLQAAWVVTDSFHPGQASALQTLGLEVVESVEFLKMTLGFLCTIIIILQP